MNEEVELKVILLGEAATGKTSLINVTIGKKFNPMQTPTVSSSYVTKSFTIGKTQYNINLWDTIGQESLRALTEIFIRDSQIVVFTYDITNRKSFEELEFWFQKAEGILGNEPIYAIVANKSDLYMEENVKETELKEYANKKKCPYKYTSATNPNSFISFLETLLENYINKNEGKSGKIKGIKLTDDNNGQNGKRRKCC